MFGYQLRRRAWRATLLIFALACPLAYSLARPPHLSLAANEPQQQTQQPQQSQQPQQPQQPTPSPTTVPPEQQSPEERQQQPTPTPATTETPSSSSSGSSTAPPEVRAFERLEWRAIGPANMGGRIGDLEGVAGNANVLYVGTASGGLWKTTNGGMRWTPLFERQGTMSIGALALEPNNPEVVWLGTGESAVRNSVSFGDGVYKSTDGGKTWQHMGLRDTRYISRIVVHPRNPDTVFVGALGHAFGANEERGVYLTTDGGRTWTRTLYIDNEHGVADLDVDATNPNIVFAAMWKFRRTPWTHTSGSDRGGLFKSIDGGRTWKKLTEGLPKLVGRIGVRVAPSNPNVVYAITEAKEGTMYRSDDRGETWRNTSKQTSIVSRGFYYTRMRVDPQNENRVYAVASTLFVSIDGGRTFRAIAPRVHIDYHALWIDPQNPRRMWAGQDGGVAVSQDGGETWEVVNNFPIGQFYQLHADNRQPFYNVMGGLQDNGSWTGPSRTREPAGILNDDWRMVSFGDGFYMLNHPDDPELYISESQGGGIVRTDMRNREQQAISPDPRGSEGALAEAKYRFNWNSPIIPSPHDKNTLYFGGHVLFKSTDFGRTWTAISPDLTTNDREKQKEVGGPIAFENTGAEFNTTIISISESPVRAGVIWVGTDDGNLQLTRDGGRTWTNVVRNIAGLRPSPEVSHVEASRTDAETAYASFDRHRLDDLRPYIYKTTDGGRTWRNISGDLPANAYVWVVREDPRNPRLVYAGTELGLFATYDGGTRWLPLNFKNLPNVAVHDIVVHPRDNDLIVATHGRSILIFDDATPVQQLTPEVLRADFHLFDVRPALRYTTRFTRYGIGDKAFTGANPPYGALLTYYLREKPDEKTPVRLQVLDATGKLVQESKQIPKEKGLNRASWNLRYGGAEVRRPPTDEETTFTGPPRGPQVLPGIYTIKLMVGEKSVEKRVEVRLDPTVNTSQADLELLRDLTIRVRDMQSATNTALRALDSTKEQLQNLEKVIKDRMPDAPKDLTTKLTDHLKQVEKLQGGLARPEGGLGFSGRSQLVDRLGSLFFEMDGTNAAPTVYQQEYFKEVQGEFQKKLAEINGFFTQTLPRLNESLRAAGLSSIVIGKPIEIPK